LDDSANYIELRIATPFGNQQTFRVKHVRIPGSEGDFGILPGHLPIISSLRIGLIEFKVDGKLNRWTCSEGYSEVVDDRVTILTEASESVIEIDINRAKNSKARAQQRLQENSVDLNISRAQLSLLRSENRLQAVSVLQ
jgi:F-type H+-transporting ATPase subunit epsilon